MVLRLVILEFLLVEYRTIGEGSCSDLLNDDGERLTGNSSQRQFNSEQNCKILRVRAGRDWNVCQAFSVTRNGISICAGKIVRSVHPGS